MSRTVYLEEVCEILDSKRVPITSKDRTKGIYPYYGANGVQDYVDGYIFDDDLVLLAEDGGNFGSKDKPIAYRVSGKCWVNNHAHVLKPKECINVDYLCYSLMFYDVGSIINGATRQKLNQSAMRKMMITLPSIEEQKQIVFNLDRVNHLIDLCNYTLEKLDALVKSRFVEMFGDPVYNPVGHLKLTVKEAIDRGFIDKPLDGNHGEKHPKTSEYVDEGIPFVMPNNLVDGKVDYKNCAKLPKERTDSLDKGFAHDGDILITHKGTIGRTAIVHTNLDYIMLTPQVTYYRPLRGIIKEYLKGYFDTDYYQREMKKLAASGGSTRAYVGITNQTQLPLIIPDLKLQHQFAIFTAQVDKSKLAVQKSLGKLETLKKSLMQEYFG